MSVASLDFKSRWACAAALVERDLAQAGMVLGIGNCGTYCEAFGVRMEDTCPGADPEPET